MAGRKAVETLNIAAAAEFLGISVQALRKYTNVEGGPVAVRGERRSLQYPKNKLEAFKKAQAKANKSLAPKRGKRSALETITA